MKQFTMGGVAGALIIFSLVFGVAIADAQSRTCTAYTTNLSTGERFRTTYPCGETIEARLERERADRWTKRLAEQRERLERLHEKYPGLRREYLKRREQPRMTPAERAAYTESKRFDYEAWSIERERNRDKLCAEGLVHPYSLPFCAERGRKEQERRNRELIIQRERTRDRLCAEGMLSFCAESKKRDGP